MTDSNQKKFKTGEIILRQGEEGRCAYVIESGRVEIFLERDGEVQYIGTRGAGTMIGEMALIDNAPRTATVRALEHCELLEITKDDFLYRLEDADPVLRMTTQVILTRYRDMLTRADLRFEGQHTTGAETLERGIAENSDALESIKIANDFENALGTNEITLNYQPIINLQTGEVDGFESLMRWKHPERGFISPAAFIPVIENSGKIVEASKWALRESVMALKRLETQFSGADHLFMSVNFSSRDFATADFVDGINEIMHQCALPASRVHLEITERLLMGQPENARDTLQLCRKAGFGVSIDDFGTGYSSLSYLHYFPINTLKIDRSFVKEMTGDASAMELIKSIISLGKNLKMKIIAEGIESKAEALILRHLGCDLGQGYHFARPMNEANTANFLKDFKPIEF